MEGEVDLADTWKKEAWRAQARYFNLWSQGKDQKSQPRGCLLKEDPPFPFVLLAPESKTLHWGHGTGIWLGHGQWWHKSWKQQPSRPAEPVAGCKPGTDCILALLLHRCLCGSASPHFQGWVFPFIWIPRKWRVKWWDSAPQPSFSLIGKYLNKSSFMS